MGSGAEEAGRRRGREMGDGVTRCKTYILDEEGLGLGLSL